jgi:hypothetical protein
MLEPEESGKTVNMPWRVLCMFLTSAVVAVSATSPERRNEHAVYAPKRRVKLGEADLSWMYI